MIRTRAYVAIAAAVLFASPLLAADATQTVRLDQLDLSNARQGWGVPRKNQSVGKHPLTIDGKKYAHGFGTHAESYVRIDVPGTPGSAFGAAVGVDDDAGNDKASVVFQVVGDKKVLWESGVMHWHDAPKQVNVPLDGIRRVDLRVTDAGDGHEFDHADWV